MASLTGPVTLPASPNPTNIPRYGLFQVATGPLDLPVNARRGGLQYQINVCDLPKAYEVECFSDLNTKSITGGPDTIVGTPFVIYSTLSCSSVGLMNWGEDRVKGWLFDQLRAGEQAVVEDTFSRSTFGLSPGLANNANVVNLGTATDVIQGTAILENWLYSRYGLPGIIHVPMMGAAYFKAAHLIEPDSAKIWRTEVGTGVSFGNYAGIGPSGQTPTSGATWMYITGQVAIWRTSDSDLASPPMGQVLNRTTNVLTTIMEREYVLTFDCYVAAVEVTLKIETS